MTATIEKPMIGLDNEFPERLYILYSEQQQKHACWVHNYKHGIACFSTEVSALRFSEHIPDIVLNPIEVTFEQAREIAKEKPHPIVCLILLDSMTNPVVHYVK